MPNRRFAVPDIAERQWGLITRQQLESLGIRPATLARLLTDRTLERVRHGVYRVRGGGEPDHLPLRAAWLALDPAVPVWRRLEDPDVALVSHASAADFFRLADLRPGVHEFTMPRRRQTRRADMRLHRGRLPTDDWVVFGGLPVTTPARTISDLLGDHLALDRVAPIVAKVIDRGYDSPSSVAEHVAPFATQFRLRRGDGAALLEKLLTTARRTAAAAPFEQR
jgi:hypothetical protein